MGGMTAALVASELCSAIKGLVLIDPTFISPEWRAIIQSIDVPVLLLTGDHGVVSPETAQELANLNPLLRHELIADAGHGLPYDMPDQAGAAMLDFLLRLVVIRDDQDAVE